MEMAKQLHIGKANLMFTFRHRWDNTSRKSDYNTEFLKYEIGLWFRKSRKVGAKDFNNPTKWGSNLVNHYMFGVNLIICKAWISFDIGGHR
jgi:hypothetical protein